ncbi:MAG: Chromosome partition protein Smc [Firmicutes bacterium]|nr:Chromosome partition protein Smc [Bacillota bacterium]
MKWLKKLRLINWHYFADETLNFGQQTIITGMTGSGKSTIIDALQVLLVANQRQIKFNSAAHEDAKRTLLSYLRGKIGSHDRTYMRENEFTTYIIAEFRDEGKRESFVIGVVMDVYRDDNIVEEYFVINDCKIKDLNLRSLNGNWCTRDEFHRSHTKKNAVFERSKTGYQNALLNRMGQLEKRFFSVFCRALSFKPLDDIRDFVYNFILEKKELQLDLLKQNFELHEKYQRDLIDLEERRSSLKHIADKYNSYIQHRDTARQQEYVIMSLNSKSAEETLHRARVSLDKENGHSTETLALVTLTNQDRDKASSNHEAALDKWKSHGTRFIQESLERRIVEQRNTLAAHLSTLSTTTDIIRRECTLVTELLAHNSNDVWQWEEADMARLESIAQCLAALPTSDVASTLVEQIKTAGEFLSTLKNRAVEKSGQLKLQIDDFEKTAQTLRADIENLKNKQRPYKEQLLKLKSLLSKHLDGRSPVWILCEELEISDEAWRNAIEGYLNTQRFDLLVRPEVFAEALNIYEQEKRFQNFDDVGLVDTEKEQKYLNAVKPDSLAQLLIAENPIVQARVNHLLGRVMLANDEQDLRLHNTAVTQSCMSYNNLVARQMARSRFEIPYIGTQALVRQLEIKQQELQSAEQELLKLKSDAAWLAALSNKLDEKKARYEIISQHLHLPQTIAAMEIEIHDLNTQLQALDTVELEALKAEVEFWRSQKIVLQGKLDNLINTRATTLAKIQDLERQVSQKEQTFSQKDEEVRLWIAQYHEDLLAKAQERLAEALKQTQPFEVRISNWETSQKSSSTRREKEFTELREARQAYNLRYSFSSNHAAEDNQTYQDVLSKVSGIDIPRYQEQLQESLQQAEVQFKSHFMHKMREALHEAKREFHRINNALKHFPFQDDRYHFELTASDKYKQFYDCIMDESLADRDSLFALPNDERSATLQNLFDRLIRGDADTQDEFTDYRRYLDFDIIVSSQGSRYSFSNVLREKSGGETQTPFYIIILAAFNQLYSNNKTMRLVVFDEAFNKMDEQRIKTSLRLIKQLKLQLIAAVPDEKLQHMAPEVTTTLVVTRDNLTCFVDMLQLEEGAATDEDHQPIQDNITLFPPE